jgi:hypothetical protein
MQTISFETVEKVWTELETLGEEEFPALVAEFSDSQPLLMAYLLAAGEDVLSESEEELLFYLGVAAWRMMTAGDNSPAEATEPVLDKVEEANYAWMENFAVDSDEEFEGLMDQLLEDYNQQHILSSVIDVIGTEIEDSEDPDVETDAADIVREESFGLMLFVVKTVVDCLDQ